MNRLLMIYGCVLLSGSAIAAVQQSTRGVTPLKETLQDKEEFENLIASLDYAMATSDYFSTPSDEKVYDLDISKIEYIEDEVVELGFDPYDYLPENFNPHSFYLDLTAVVFVEEETHSLGFDTEKYLPLGFDANKEATDLTAIHFIEEEDVALGFETEKYLPEGFSAYEPYFDLNSIDYIEMDNWDDCFSALPEVDRRIEEPFN